MKKLVMSTVLASTALLGGCATSMPVGGLFTDVTLPVAVTANGVATKTGTASCSSILGMVATGDCSIETAKLNGGIKEVTHVDWKANNLLGIIGNYEVVVHGK